jgi:hypothetical protein
MPTGAAKLTILHDSLNTLNSSAAFTDRRRTPTAYQPAGIQTNKNERDLANALVELNPRRIQYASCRAALDSPHQQQDNENEHHEAQTAAWVISPPSAVRPGWQRAQEQQNQNN